jgi:aminopeptidase N
MHKHIIWIVILSLFANIAFAQDDNVGDPYYPQAGNTGYDVQHYTIDMAVALEPLTADVTTTIEAIATNDLPTFNLDFFGWEISSITVDGTEATFSREGQELTVTPAAPIVGGATFSVVVAYGGEPGLYPDPAMEIPTAMGADLSAGLREWSEGYYQAISQPDGAMSWYPLNNHPSDKATYTFRLTVDDPYTAVATGILQEVIPVDEDTNTFIWEMTDLMSAQVSGIAIGEFELVVSVAPNGVPIRNYFPVGTSPEVIAAFDKTGEMMVFIEDMLGEYPFDAYGVVIVPEWAGGGAALETQAMSTFSPDYIDEEVVMHELFHQWFGNSLTAANWDDVWLHEGFAQYSEALWTEHTLGYKGYLSFMLDRYSQYVVESAGLPAMLGDPLEPLQFMSAANPGLQAMYVPTYTGGALTLHALRMEVGDEIFFEILRTFYQNHAYGNASTEDFIATAEDLAGRDLNATVWEPWLYATVAPTEFLVQPRTTD